MTNYQQSMEQLQTAIVENKPEEAIELLGKDTPSLPSRLNAYIFGYRARLKSAVEADYPALKHYMGAALFDQYASAYVEETTSDSYTIDLYPLGFAAYLATNEYNEQAACDLATLESTIAEIFWLPDSDPFIPDPNFSMEKLLEITFNHRSASKLLMLGTSAEDYLSAYRSNTPNTTIASDATYMMIIRHNNEVRRHLLSEAEHSILVASKNNPFAEALEMTLANRPEFTNAINSHLGEWIGKWIEQGFFRHG